MRTFDELGRLKTETTPNTPAETVTYGHNAAGDLTSLTDGRGRVTVWAYNTEGRLTGKRYHGQNFDQVTYGYYADGRLNWRRYYSSASVFRQTTYTYDPSGNLTLIDYPSPTVDVSAGYNSANRLTNVVQSGLGTINLGWANGRLIQESGPWPNSAVTRVFPANAFRPNELRVQNNATSAQDWVVAYGYDSSGRLQNLTSPVGQFTYSYTGATGSGYAGALVNEIQLPGGGKVNHDWDGLGRLTLTEFRNNPANGAITQNQHNYTYDVANRRQQQVRTGSSAVTLNYGYDDLGQLTSANIVGGASTAYAYHGGWNMTNRAGQAYTVNDFNPVTAGEGFTYSYDSNGNRTSRTLTATGQFIQYTYDDENRLIQAQTDNVATAEQGRWRTEFIYDGFGRLRNRRELMWQFGGWYETTQTRYLYDGWRVVQERAGTLPQVAYTRGLDLSGSLEGVGGIGGLLARSSSYQSASGTYASHAFYHADGGGNVTFLSPSTYTGSEAALTRYVYDAFGRTTSANGPLWSANLYRFSSKEVHAASGLYYYGYRFYDPQTQRWLNRDPIGERDTINLYAFVRNNPIGHVDKLGLGTIMVDNSCNGHGDLLKGMTYYAESEPPDDGEKVHRSLPEPGWADRSVDADAIYWGDGTATKIPDLRWIRVVCVCKDGKWSVKQERGGIPVPRRPFVDWKRGALEPPNWPGRGQPENPPHNGTPPRPPLPPLNPGNGTVDGPIFR